MNKIVLTSVEVEKRKIIYRYTIQGNIKKYFSSMRTFTIEYATEIDKISWGGITIPFVSNVIPIVWLTNSKLELPYLDKVFYDKLKEIKKGYQQMYPMLSFDGEIEVKEFTYPNRVTNSFNTACFFSGGVDAYTTMLRHIEEKPTLLTIWGSDVKLTDESGWRNVYSHIEKVGQEYNLPTIWIKSDFRNILQESELDKLVKVSRDGWWHGFQHGIGIISHAAPLAEKNGYGKLYIASSFFQEMKGKYTCASDPTIDNYMCFGNTKTIHDAYELSRQEKVGYIVKRKKDLQTEVNLHVCWISAGGKNCCRCEKCYRTILELISEGADPNQYGFEWGNENILQCRRDFENKITMGMVRAEQYYVKIQKKMIKNRKIIRNLEEYAWFMEMDFLNEKFNNKISKKFRKTILFRIWRKGNKILLHRNID